LNGCNRIALAQNNGLNPISRKNSSKQTSPKIHFLTDIFWTVPFGDYDSSNKKNRRFKIFPSTMKAIFTHGGAEITERTRRKTTSVNLRFLRASV
jgi:hypothetical protein